jgi:hypothetical protein
LDSGAGSIWQYQSGIPMPAAASPENIQAFVMHDYDFGFFYV